MPHPLRWLYSADTGLCTACLVGKCWCVNAAVTYWLLFLYNQPSSLVRPCVTRRTFEVSRSSFLQFDCLSCCSVNCTEALKGIILQIRDITLPRRETRKKWGMVEVGTDWSGWSGTQPDGLCVCLCQCSSLHHKVQKFSSGTGSPGWSRKKGRKMIVVVVVRDVTNNNLHLPLSNYYTRVH